MRRHLEVGERAPKAEHPLPLSLARLCRNFQLFFYIRGILLREGYMQKVMNVVAETREKPNPFPASQAKDVHGPSPAWGAPGTL